MSSRGNLKRKNLNDESPTIQALKYTKKLESSEEKIHNLTANYIEQIKNVSNNEDTNNIFKQYMIEVANNFNAFLDNGELNLKNIDTNLTFLKKTLNDLYKNKKDIYESSIKLKEIYTKYPELQQTINALHHIDKKISIKQENEQNLNNDL